MGGGLERIWLNVCHITHPFICNGRLGEEQLLIMWVGYVRSSFVQQGLCSDDGNLITGLSKARHNIAVHVHYVRSLSDAEIWRSWKNAFIAGIQRQGWGSTGKAYLFLYIWAVRPCAVESEAHANLMSCPIYVAKNSMSEGKEFKWLLIYKRTRVRDRGQHLLRRPSAINWPSHYPAQVHRGTWHLETTKVIVYLRMCSLSRCLSVSRA